MRALDLPRDPEVRKSRNNISRVGELKLVAISGGWS